MKIKKSDTIIARDGKFFIGYHLDSQPIFNDIFGDIIVAKDGSSFTDETSQQWLVNNNHWVKIDD